jgi:hypothetical protein
VRETEAAHGRQSPRWPCQEDDVDLARDRTARQAVVIEEQAASIVDGRVLLVEGFHDEVASGIDKMTWDIRQQGFPRVGTPAFSQRQTY